MSGMVCFPTAKPEWLRLTEGARHLKSRLSVEINLATALEAARNRKQLAREAYEYAIKIATDAPRPEGLLQMKNAAMEYRTARDAHRLALQRFTAFATRGTVPDDLD